MDHIHLRPETDSTGDMLYELPMTFTKARHDLLQVLFILLPTVVLCLVLQGIMGAGGEVIYTHRQFSLCH